MAFERELIEDMTNNFNEQKNRLYHLMELEITKHRIELNNNMKTKFTQYKDKIDKDIQDKLDIYEKISHFDNRPEFICLKRKLLEKKNLELIKYKQELDENVNEEILRHRNILASKIQEELDTYLHTINEFIDFELKRHEHENLKREQEYMDFMHTQMMYVESDEIQFDPDFEWNIQ